VTVVARINKPTEDTRTFVYDGTEQTYSVNKNNTWSDMFTVINAARTEAGTQTVTVRLKDSEYVRWTDNTRDELTFTFTIAAATDNKISTVTVPNWTYGNTAGDPEADNAYGTVQYWYRPIGGTDDDWTTIKPTDAGEYEVKAVVTATDSYNGTEKVAAFTIGKALVEKPLQGDTRYIYDGEEQTFEIADSDKYTISGNVQSEIGEYTVIISLNDKNNYAWADGSSDDLEYVYTITDEQDLSVLVGILAGAATLEVLIGLIAWGKKYRKGK
jgi:hypothetical protein